MDVSWPEAIQAVIDQEVLAMMEAEEKLAEQAHRLQHPAYRQRLCWWDTGAPGPRAICSLLEGPPWTR